MSTFLFLQIEKDKATPGQWNKPQAAAAAAAAALPPPPPLPQLPCDNEAQI